MNSQSILIVDDEMQIRVLFCKAFRAAGYTVHGASSAEEALRVQEVSPAEVLFLDLNLPGMNGLDLCREIRKHWPWSIAIAVTGYASLFELLDCREAGFEDYFIKPVGLEELLAVAKNSFAKIQRWKLR